MSIFVTQGAFTKKTGAPQPEIEEMLLVADNLLTECQKIRPSQVIVQFNSLTSGLRTAAIKIQSEVKKSAACMQIDLEFLEKQIRNDYFDIQERLNPILDIEEQQFDILQQMTADFKHRIDKLEQEVG